MGEGLKVALVFLTRVPVRSAHDLPLAQATPWFPVVGAAVGGVAGLVFAGLTLAGMPSFPAALVVIALLAIATGALHEDGLADCADALGVHERARRLGIMRDSRIGTFGALALILVTLGRVAGLSTLWDPVAQILTLVVIGAASRGAMVVLMRTLPAARPDGLAARAGRPDPISVAIAIALPALFAVTLLGPVSGLLLLGAGGLALALWARVAHRAFGGRTGDVLGAAQQLVEVAMLLSLTMLD